MAWRSRESLLGNEIVQELRADRLSGASSDSQSDIGRDMKMMMTMILNHQRHRKQKNGEVRGE
jgi:hypothetical protein